MEARHNNPLPTWAARLAGLLCIALLTGPVVAAEVYRWVDENGEVH